MFQYPIHITSQDTLSPTIKECMQFLELLKERRNRTQNINTTSRTTSFPALYQITDANGTNVYSSTESGNSSKSEPNVLRTIEHNTIVLGQGIIQTSFSEPSYIKIPDGYVLESSVTRVATIYQQPKIIYEKA